MLCISLTLLRNYAILATKRLAATESVSRTPREPQNPAFSTVVAYF